MDKDLQKEFDLLEDGILELIKEHKVSTLGVFTTMIFMNLAISKGVIERLNAALEDKNIFDGVKKDDIQKTKELTKSIESYIDVGGKIIKLMTGSKE